MNIHTLNISSSHPLRLGLILGLLGIMGSLGAGSAQTAIPASWAYPMGSQDAKASGFFGRIHQARSNASLSATIARGNAQLNGTLTDPATGKPYINLVMTTTNPYATSGAWTGYAVNADGSFIETNVINYSIDAPGLAGDLGNFNSITGHPDLAFPGLPGANDADFITYENVGNLAIEEVAFLELKAGTYTFGVNCDDSFELAIHPNDARDIFRKSIASFGSNRGTTQTTGTIQIEADGLYSFRLLHAQYQSSPPAELEFYTLDQQDPLNRILVNDLSQSAAIKAWQKLSQPTRPYVTSIEPAADATGVQATAPIRVVMERLGTNSVAMKVNGVAVTPSSTVSGETTTLTYTPSSPLPGGSVVRVELQYGAAVGSWSYVTRTGIKALMIVGGTATASDNWMAARLASQFGLDIIVKTDSAVQTNDAAGTVLIVNSATVNSGNVASKNFEELPIPILNGEQGNVDDFLMGATGGNINITQLEIVDSAHPLAAGLTNGVYDLYTGTGSNQGHQAIAAQNASVVGTVVGNQAQVLIFGIDEGFDFQGFIHPARRVHLGFIGNDGGVRFNNTGIQLFDAAIRWLLKLPDQPPRFNAPLLTNGKITISWEGEGTLQEAASLNGPWTAAASQTNPQTITAAGIKFFRIKR